MLFIPKDIKKNDPIKLNKFTTTVFRKGSSSKAPFIPLLTRFINELLIVVKK